MSIIQKNIIQKKKKTIKLFKPFLITATLFSFFFFILSVFDQIKSFDPRAMLISISDHMCFKKIKYDITTKNGQKICITSDKISLYNTQNIHSINTYILFQDANCQDNLHNIIEIIAPIASTDLLKSINDGSYIYFPKNVYINSLNKFNNWKIASADLTFLIDSLVISGKKDIQFAYDKMSIFAKGYYIDLKKNEIKLLSSVKILHPNVKISTDKAEILASFSEYNNNLNMQNFQKIKFLGKTKIESKNMIIDCNNLFRLALDTITILGNVNVFLKSKNLKISTNELIINVKNRKITNAYSDKNITIVGKNFSIKADKASFANNIIKASGNVFAKQLNGSFLRCEAFEMNVENNDIKIKNSSGKSSTKIVL